MKNKNSIIIICSVIVGIAAAVVAVLLVLKHLKTKNAELETTDYVFENEFDDDEPEVIEDIAE